MANYCRKCGQPLEINYKVCPICGTKVQDDYQTSYTRENRGQENELLWGVLGFFVPIVGIILFFIWQDTRPIAAKNAGIGGLLGLAVRFVFGFVGFSLFFPFYFFNIFGF